MVPVKICGLTTRAHVEAAAQAGAAYVGFVFFSKSPRNLSIQAARSLAESTPARVLRVGLTVDAKDSFLDELIAKVPLDMLQLHGVETLERVVEIKRRFNLPVMKALGIAKASDLEKIDLYAAVCDQILVDAKPPTSGVSPGGNGLSFDWKLITGHRWTVPWMLAGGLTPETVPTALKLTAAPQLDVSSGVETSPGEKDLALISEFIAAAQRPVWANC